MNVLVVEPGYLPYEKEVNGLHEMQAVVGGLIDVIYPYADPVAIVCNDEALLYNMPFNRSVEGGYGGVFGNFFICGLGEEDFASLSPELMQKYKEKFKNAELLIGAKGNELVTLKFKADPKPKPEQQKGTQRNEAQR